MPQRLRQESSPYLLQHADNPVDWYPWGPEALARAAAEDKPILLSIGYSACHWCHVMAHESFENEATAALMNEHFVNIKVDREERPDLDGIYMQAVQAMTGHGGWPMTVFLTPSGEPFYGGTYFPPVERHGMPSFPRLLQAISDTWRNRRETVHGTTRQLRELLAASSAPNISAPPPGESSGADGGGALDRRVLEGAYQSLSLAHDAEYGGFGSAPKFPPSMALDFLLRHWARTGAEFALDIALRSFRAMARGGVYDQVGGGLHRYSVDERWLVPHFEKMLYDNALFARLGVRLCQATGDHEIGDATRATLRWVAREMTAPDGGFHSSRDADSDGEEGRFYVWDDDELAALLGQDASLLRRYWGTTPRGNFEGRNILHVAAEPSVVAREFDLSLAQLAAVVARGRDTLYAERRARTWPALDDKVIASWNGLMLCAVAEGARVFDDGALRALAIRNGEFLRDTMTREGRVFRSFRLGVRKEVGFLEDHAAVALGFLELYSLTFDAGWLAEAMKIADVMVDRFYEPERALFFDTARDHEALITRPRDVTDNAVPSGTSLAADLLLRLSIITGDERGAAMAQRICGALADGLQRHPSAFGHLLGVTDMSLFGATEVVLVGDTLSAPFRRLQRAVASTFVPSLVLAGGDPDPESPFALLHGRTAPPDGAQAYVCRRYQCEAPTSEPDDLEAQLGAIRGG